PPHRGLPLAAHRRRGVRDQAPDLGRRVGARRLLDVPALLPGDLRQETLRDDGARRARRNVVVGGERVAMLDEQPRRLARWATPGADEDPRAAELLAAERELELALAEPGIDVRYFGCPGAAI